MKVQFIVVGWHFENFPAFIDGLLQFKNDNPEVVNVFWSCHREPSQRIKDNFDYKVFPNLGLEDGAYQQALDHLDIPGDTFLFLMHDDLEVKDWSFINECLRRLATGYCFVGNGRNYPADIDPGRLVLGKPTIEYVKEESKYLFDKPMMCFTIRESFLCTMRKYLRQIHDFEVVWQEPVADENGKFHIGGIGNLQQALLGYKLTKIFPGRVSYLSDTYQDSNWLYECARGTKG